MAYLNFLVADMTLTLGVTLTLKHKINATSGFLVPENVGVEPLFGFISGEITEIYGIFLFAGG